MLQWARSTLVQMMACAYSAPSPYPKQYWVIVNWNLRNKRQWNFNRNTKFFIRENTFENIVCETAPILSRGDELSYKFTIELLRPQMLCLPHHRGLQFITLLKSVKCLLDSLYRIWYAYSGIVTDLLMWIYYTEYLRNIPHVICFMWHFINLYRVNAYHLVNFYHCRCASNWLLVN